MWWWRSGAELHARTADTAAGRDHHLRASVSFQHRELQGCLPAAGGDIGSGRQAAVSGDPRTGLQLGPGGGCGDIFADLQACELFRRHSADFKINGHCKKVCTLTN